MAEVVRFFSCANSLPQRVRSFHLLRVHGERPPAACRPCRTQDRRWFRLPGIENVDHQPHDGARGVKLARLFVGGVGELLDQVFIGLAEDVRSRLCYRGGCVKSARSDRGAANRAGDPCWTTPHRRRCRKGSPGLPFRCRAWPFATLGRRWSSPRVHHSSGSPRESENGNSAGTGHIPHLHPIRPGPPRIPRHDIADSLKKEQRKDVGLEVGRIDRTAKDVGCFPEVRFQCWKIKCCTEYRSLLTVRDH